MQRSERYNQILEAAIRVARLNGYQTITRDQVAKEASCAASLIYQYFEDMGHLRNMVLTYAVIHEDPVIIAQGMANHDEFIKQFASTNSKRKACEVLNEAI